MANKPITIEIDDDSNSKETLPNIPAKSEVTKIESEKK